MFFLGIDGGGTTTEFMIINSEGEILAFGIKPTCHYKQTSLENFKNVLKGGIKDVCKGAGINLLDIEYSILGIPGYGEIEDDVLKIESIVRDVLGTDKFKCVNDAVVGWAGSLGCQSGINIVAGTGTIGYGMDSSGNSARTGGWGHNCGDEGSAYWIGKKVIELFTKQSDGRISKTLLYDIVRSNLELEEDFDLLNIILNEYRMERNKIANLSLLMYEAAKEGDLLARDVFYQAAYEHYLMIKALIEKLDFAKEEKVLVSYSGGVFNSGDYVLLPLKRYVSELSKKIELTKPLLRPISGAALYAYMQVNKDVNNNTKIINKIQSLEKKKMKVNL